MNTFYFTAYFAFTVGLPIAIMVILGARKKYLSNDLSRDGKHWNYNEVVIAAYVTIWQDDEQRLNDNYQVFIGSILKRSDRAVAEQMRRIRTAASTDNLASEFVQDIAFNVAAMPEPCATDLFKYAVSEVGGAKALAQLNKLYI